MKTMDEMVKAALYALEKGATLVEVLQQVYEAGVESGVEQAS